LYILRAKGDLVFVLRSSRNRLYTVVNVQSCVSVKRIFRE